jgi:hypothetical protein
MVRETSAHAEEDRAQRERNEIRNRVEALIAQASKYSTASGDRTALELGLSLATNARNLSDALQSEEMTTDELRWLTVELERLLPRRTERFQNRATGEQTAGRPDTPRRW